MKQFLHHLKNILTGILLSLSFFASAQSQQTNAEHLPNFTSVSGTQLTNTNGQWVTFNPTQPNNIDLLESRIFKMPAAGQGILGIEFKVVGADGGTARFQWGLNDKFANGGRGGELTFTLPLQNTNNYDRPFFVTFGKKGESRTIHNGLYIGAGGGGSTGMAWLEPGAETVYLNYTGNYLIAAAGGGSGGYATEQYTLAGKPAMQIAAATLAISDDDVYDYLNVVNNNNGLVLVMGAGGSKLRFKGQSNQILPFNYPYCCTNDEKLRALTSKVYNISNYTTGVNIGTSGVSLNSITYGQGGGKPTTPFVATTGTGNMTGMGMSYQTEGYEVLNLGGKGGSGFGGGGAGVSTTTHNHINANTSVLPTGGAGGTGSPYKSAYAHAYPNNADAGWNAYPSYLQNVIVSPRTTTNDPQNGKLMYRTIVDSESPVVSANQLTINLNPNGTFPLTLQSFQPYIGTGPGKIISDNDGIRAMTFSPSQLTCNDIGQTVPVLVTAYDFATDSGSNFPGNSAGFVLWVTVTDNVAPVAVLPEPVPPGYIVGSDIMSHINITGTTYTLTAANFPKGIDGCNGSNGVTLHFPPTTFGCNNVGNQPIDYYFTDAQGNTSPVYTKTFIVTYSGSTTSRFYVDHTATGANNGSSWADAYTDLQDAVRCGGDGREVYVAKGTYRPDRSTADRSATFNIPQNVKMYGGFPNGGSTLNERNPETNPTILSGEIGSAATNDNSYHVVTVSGSNVLDGFTIRDGYANSGATDGGGGLKINQSGALTTDSRVSVRNCKFLDNKGNTVGGAVAVSYGNNATINYLDFENCLFQSNANIQVSGSGGAVNYSSISNLTQTFTNCVFNNNQAKSSGGALMLKANTQTTITNCTFANNTASGAAGAIHNTNGAVTMHNSIMYFNTATMYNQILNTGTFKIDYSNVEGSGGSSNWSATLNAIGVQDLGNNIDANPLFHTSPALSLLPQSPSRNTGKNSHNTLPFDLSNTTRISQNVIDMGAYELSEILYVAADAPAGGNGNSWATAFNNLNEAITAAGTLQKDIWIKEGTYRPDCVPGSNTVTPNNRENSFYINNNIAIYGGFGGTETGMAQRNIGQYPTILSGDLGLANIPGDNAYHVITMQANNARLDGLIIENGNADHATDTDKQRGGGVIEYAENTGSNNIVANCVLRNNRAIMYGGAWYTRANNQGSTNFVQSVFYGNTAFRGAASYVLMNHSQADSFNQNYYNVTATGNTNIQNIPGSGVFEAAEQSANKPANIKFYNSLLAGNAPQNYSDVTNPGHIALTNTYEAVANTDIFVNASNFAGADGKIMTTDDGLQLNSSSPAINYGDNTLVFSGIDKDVTGSQRILNNIDAGAYESTYTAPLIPDANGIIYVKLNATGNGTGWNNPTGDLHNAIQAAGVQRVYVAVGTYKVGDNSFIMKNGVQIYGGFDPENSITDLSHSRIMPNAANQQGSILDGENARPVIWNVCTASAIMDNTAVLDGFTIIRGTYANGGGIRNVYASPTLTNLLISGNAATVSGAGIYNENSSPLITNTVVSSNVIVNAGLNTVVNGAGVSNTASSAPIFTNINIIGNILIAPLGTMKGAGMYSNNSSPKIYNSIIWNNQKMNNPAISGVDLEKEGTGTLTLKNSMTQLYSTGNTSDNNKVSVNPMFTNLGVADYRLLESSPAINAGDNALYTGLNASTKDLTNNSRVYNFPNNGIVDMGAFEYQCIYVDYSNITFDDVVIDYDGNLHSIAVQNLPQEASVTYEITNVANQTTSGNTATNAGVYAIKATMSVTGANCSSVTRTATLTINKIPAVITATNVQSYVYDGTVKNVTASLNHTEVPLDYSPQQGYTDAGSYWVTVSVPETTNYLAASENVVLVIENADFTGITLNDAAFTYDGTPKSLAITGTLPTGAELAYSGNGQTESGVYTVNALIQMPNYNDLWLTATMTINKAMSVITSNSTQTHVYDGTVKNVMATLNHNEVTLVYTPQQGYTDVGTYPIIISVPETANYLAATENISLVIETADFIGITFNDASFTYDGNSHSIFVNGAPAGATVTYTGNGQTNIGTYTVNASVQMPNYNDLNVSATMTINNATLTGITFNNGTFTYDGTAHSIFASGVPAGATVTYTGNGQTNAGVYTVNALVQMPNYNDLQLSATMTIDNAVFTGVTFNNGTFTYDGTAHSIFVSGLPTGATVTYTGNGQTNAGV